jgi:hypothetical protein
VGLNPLLGITGEIDLLTALLNAAGGVGATLNYIRQLCESDENARISLWLKATFSGTLSASLSYEKQLDQSSGQGSGQLTGEIAASVEGGGEYEFKKFFVKAGGGAKLGGKASLKSTIKAQADHVGPYLEGTNEFTGLVIYAAYWSSVNVEVKKKESKTEKGVASDNFDELTTTQGTDKGGGTKYENAPEWIVIEPREWPCRKYYLFKNTAQAAP